MCEGHSLVPELGLLVIGERIEVDQCLSYPQSPRPKSRNATIPQQASLFTVITFRIRLPRACEKGCPFEDTDVLDTCVQESIIGPALAEVNPVANGRSSKEGTIGFYHWILHSDG